MKEENLSNKNWKEYYKREHNLSKEDLEKLPNEISPGGFITGVPKKGMLKTARTLAQVTFNYIFFNPPEITVKHVPYNNRLTPRWVAQ